MPSNAAGFETATRIGFAARGVMYVLIGYLALRSGRTEDGAGIIDYLDSGGGRILLAAMAVGFLAYGVWRLLDAWLDSSGHGGDAGGIAVRAGGAVSGLLHLGLGVAAVMHAASGGGGGGSGEATQEGARTALSLPGGWLALVALAAGLAATGLFQLAKAWNLDFLQKLDGRARGTPWVAWLGCAGFLARGIVFLLVAWLFWRAAMAERSDEAGGLGDALASLPPTLQMLVAGGLLLFGLFSFVEARFRRIPDLHAPGL